MAHFLGMSAVGWQMMTTTWYDKVLIALLSGSIAAGLVYVIYCIASIAISAHRRRASRPIGLTKTIAERIERLSSDASLITPTSSLTTSFESFGVYLGHFNHTLTPSQAAILSTWSTIILNPFSRGVAKAIKAAHEKELSTNFLARYDLAVIAGHTEKQTRQSVNEALDALTTALNTTLLCHDGITTPFHGVVLAGWHSHFSSAILNKLIRVLSSRGLAVFLEIAPPAYLSDDECNSIDLSRVKGIVIRNGAVLQNGDRRNFFQMSQMLKALRALARENPAAAKMLWDTVESEQSVEHAVVKRTYNWCRFNSALSYISPESALLDAEVALEQTVVGEPLGAFMWLKNNSIMNAQATWRANDHVADVSTLDQDAFDGLVEFFPFLDSTLSLYEAASADGSNDIALPIESFTWPSSCPEKHYNPFSFSSSGAQYNSMGCFQLGLDADMKEHADLTTGQKRLRDMKLLKQVEANDLDEIRTSLQCLLEAGVSKELSSATMGTIAELVAALTAATGDEEDDLRVFVGLHSGFHNGTTSMWWGLYEANYLSGRTDIFLSGKVADRTGALLHTFLSSRHISRAQCFLAEVALAEQTGQVHKKWQLPKRIVNDVESLTTGELMLLLRRMSGPIDVDCRDMVNKLRAACTYQLIEVPTLTQLREQNTTAYLRNEISVDDLVVARLAWHRDQGCATADPLVSVALFKQVESRITAILMNQESKALTQFENLLCRLIQEDRISVPVDLLALAVFCAFRKLALAELNLEVLDRNPLPNQHPDQAACFAEMFGTGSQCEAYFDITANVLGQILSDMQQAYYRENQPPLRDDKTTELPTAYASMGVDLDPNAKPLEVSFYYRITFLGIFALPALCDITLLTTLGRGLYISYYMSQIEKQMATAALMVSLLITGAFGTWISSGGVYYLHSMAYPAMNMYVVTRFLAGLSCILAVGLAAFIGIGFAISFWGGFIFFAYFLLLSLYLMTLATLSIYQIPGFSFLSGRTTIITRIPILFISPLITLWLGHDILVYLCVLTGFVLSLVFSARGTISRWSSWYLNIDLISDNQVAEWYVQSGSEARDKAAGVPEYVISAPRKALSDAVDAERALKPWQKSSAEPIVKKLAASYPATMFLLAWYTQYSRTKMPFPYSATWNLQCKASIDTLKDMQKGLKLHNAFLHWRHAGAEVWCGVLYFVVALMDKWVSLLTGDKLVGLSAADSSAFRLPVGFGLAYYLIAAVCLDGVATPLWVTANKRIAQPIKSMTSLNEVMAMDAADRSRRYWTSLAKFFFMHTWGLAVAAALMWVFENNSHGAIMFLAYGGSYTGLLWYQYNRIYAGSLVAKDLIFSAIIGLIVGITLKTVVPAFEFGAVIALAATTWTAACLSFVSAKIVRWRKSSVESAEAEKPEYSVGTLEQHSDFSTKFMADLYASAEAHAAEDIFRISAAAQPGVDVMQILASTEKTTSDSSVERIRQRAVELWSGGRLVVDLVGMKEYLPTEQRFRSVAKMVDEHIHLFIFVGLDYYNNEWFLDVQRNAKVIAEAIIRTTAELSLGVSQQEACVAEAQTGSHGSVSVPEGIKRGLESSSDFRRSAIQEKDTNILRGLFFGLDCDTEWESLPSDIRTLLLQRACGKDVKISEEQCAWLADRFGADKAATVQQLVSTSNDTATISAKIADYARSIDDKRPGVLSRSNNSYLSYYNSPASSSASSTCLSKTSTLVPRTPLGTSQLSLVKEEVRIVKSPLKALKAFGRTSMVIMKTFVKFVAAAMVADPELQRELNFLLRNRSLFLGIPPRVFIIGIWLYTKAMQSLFIPFIFLYNRPKIARLARNIRGIKSSIKKTRIAIDGFSGPSTCFTKKHTDGTLELRQYSGTLDKEPEAIDTLLAITIYDKKTVLLSRQQYNKGEITNEFEYDYSTLHKRTPIARRCIGGPLTGQIIQYDDKGHMTCGSYLKDENLVSFNLWYRKHAEFDDELLRAEYRMDHMNIRVSWCVPPVSGSEKFSSWVPFSKVVEATFNSGNDTYHATWDYDHKFHPRITCLLNGEECDTPPMIEHDWYNVFQKPKSTNFAQDSPLFNFRAASSSLFSRVLGLNKSIAPVSTSRGRTQLWKAWKDTKDLDAITARWLDEISLRKEPTLKAYWFARDLGMLDRAKMILEERYNTVMARVDIDAEVSSWTPLAYKVSDLKTFGTGGDTRINTKSVATQMRDNDEQLHVLAMDTGTWPNEAGGVSACRRDMVNDLKSIRWHVIAESANDYGVPRFQIERNVQSLSVLPLWGLDFLTPTHGIFEDYLDTYVEENSLNSTDEDIKRNFLPILTSLIKCSRAIKFTRQHIDEATRALVDLNTYFTEGRHWGDVWNSDLVKQTWREQWLSDNDDNQVPIERWLNAECPTEAHLDQALDMWHRYLFIFSLPVPEEIPDVFQASHHFAGASYGVLCKVKRNCTLHVWDHCISWREVTVFLSSSMSFDPPFVCTSLISLSRMTSVLILHHADVVLPCADFFNPGWEIELGSQANTICHRKQFARKIDPVVNGICNMEKFVPIKEIKTEKPTAVMLSHVRFVKDIKNAILAADIIVNEWGFKDYRLDVYGDMEKAPAYSVECQEIIASKKLRENVVLRGLGSPSKVLEDAWLFLNSSVSEGLPLAMGEAALTGVPVVCTDVGASFRVVTDPVTWEKFSAVVAPNDALSLARAQVNILGLLDEWAKFGEGDERPKLSYSPTKEEVDKIQARMYEQKDARRRLGMMGRDNVLSSFSSERYLREHEQMLWIGKDASPSFRAKSMRSTPATSTRSTPLLGSKFDYGRWSMPSSSGNSVRKLDLTFTP